jgi:predicted RNA-binding Zn ribbon-like protein
MSDTQDETAFNLIAGNPALDLVNTLDNRFRSEGCMELLTSYADLLRFMQQSNLLSAQQVRSLAGAAKHGVQQSVLQSARELREALASAFYASTEHRIPTPAAIRILQRHFLKAREHRELQWKSSRGNPTARRGPSWSWGPHEGEPALPVWMLAQAASELLMSDDLARVRTCGSETCRWLFFDTSKNHTRRWCDMKICGNRMKARRFQARQHQ